MAQVLKIGAVDLSTFVRVAHEDGLDPANPEYSEPQFGGSTAFGEGQTFVGDSVSNRQMSFPVILKAATTDAVYALVREINAALIRGALVEYRSGGASQSTFFDLERGRLEEKFEFWLDQAGRARALLHLWVRPRGHTGTTRQIISAPAGSAAAMQLPATGVIGDVNALANLEVRVGSSVASNGRVIAYGLHPHPSFNGLRNPQVALAQPGATQRGASGALASQYVAIPVSPTAASGIAYTAFLDPPEAHVGRHRVLAIGRSGLNVPLSLYAEDRYGAVLGSALATQTDQNKWQLLDLGEVQVPSRMAGQEPVPTQFVNIIGGGASGAVINASPAFHLDQVMFLPLDYSAGILRTPGARQTAVFQDAFSRFGLESKTLESLPNPEIGAPWTRVEGELAGGNGQVLNQYASTIFYDAASGAQNANIEVAGQFKLNPEIASILATGSFVDLWAKRQPGAASAGVWARLTFGPTQMLQLFAGNGTTATVMASAGIASTLASGLYQGQEHRLTVKANGGRADVWLATGALSPSPILSASHAFIAAAGNPALRGKCWNAAGLFFDNIVAQQLTGASDIGARESFRFESYPQKRVIQGNASVFKADRVAEHRGNLPQIPPVGSPATTGPAQLVVFQGEIDNVIGNDGADVIVGVRERFTYLR